MMWLWIRRHRPYEVLVLTVFSVYLGVLAIALVWRFARLWLSPIPSDAHRSNGDRTSDKE
jgi:hypothetical protein